MNSFRSRWSRPKHYAQALVLMSGLLGPALHAQPIVTLPDVTSPIFTRPGGSNFYWVYPLYSNATHGVPNPSTVTHVSYYNVPAPANYNLTRGTVEYAGTTAGPWTSFPSPSAGYSAVATAGRVFRFVDTMPADNTTQNTVGVAWHAAGVGPITSGMNVFPDLPPTDVFTVTEDFWHAPAQGEVVVGLKNTDTGAPFNYGGKYTIDSQSVPNLFAVSGEDLVRGTGALPAVGASATVTLRYSDLFQLDNNGNALPGAGATRTITLTRRSNPTGFSNEVVANTYTASAQQNPTIAGLTDGGYVVVWRSPGQGESTSLGGIYGQKFTAAGAKSGSEFAISAAGNGINELAPAVAALASGRFVVSYTQVNTDNDVKFRIVEANGTVGAEMSAPASSTGAQASSAVDSTSSGFAITWLAPSASTDNDVWVRRFGNDGTPVASSEYVINSTLTGIQNSPGIAGLSDGSYVAIWRDPMNDGDIRGRKLGATAGDGSEFAVTSTAGSQLNSRVAALANGGFVVVYQQAARTEGVVVDTASESNVYARLYSNAAGSLGSEFLVNGGTRGTQALAAVAGLSGGGFIATWTANTDLDGSTGILGRRFTDTGTAIDHDFQITQRREDGQNQSVVTPLLNNSFAAAWADATVDGDGNGVVARAFTATVPLPNLTINDVSLNEGNAGTTSYTFTVSLSSAAPAGGVTFDIATANGTATSAGSDYTGQSLTAQTIPAGGSTYSFTVLVNGDTTYESNETFFVNVTNVTGATVTDAQGQGTIVNDDTDTTPPDTTITGNPTNPTNDNTPTFTFTGTDNVGVTGFEVRFGTIVSFTTATSPYTPSALADGTYTFQVRAKDAAGNVDATPASFTFTVDATAPAAPVATAPANGSRTADNTPTYTGTAEAGSTVSVIVDGIPVGTTTATGGNWTLTQPVPLADGSHTVRATATDSLGNTSVSSSTNTFTVDTTPPPAPVTVTPANGSTTADSTPAITGTAEANATVNVIIDGSVVGTPNADAGGSWTFTPSTPLAPGAHTARSTATDAAGNTGPNSNTNNFTLIEPVNVTGLLSVSGIYTPGSTVTYTVSLGNSSVTAQPDNPGNEFTFTAPSQIEITGASATTGTASSNATTVTWNGGIAGQSFAIITITGTLKTDATGIVSAQGTINYDADANGSNESTALTDHASSPGNEDPTTFEVIPGSVSVAHAVTDTSVGGNDGVATIGETITHTITVTVPDGTTPGSSVRAMLPTGLAYVAGSASVNTTGFNGTVSGFILNSNASMVHMSMTHNATADGVAANNRYVITFQTTVQDVVSNSGLTPAQTVLTTGITHNAGGMDSSFTAPLANASVTVVEPRVLAATTISQTSANVGGTVAFGVSLQNTGTSTAHGVSGTLTLPATHFDIASIANPSTSGGFSFSVNLATGLLTFSSDIPLAPGISGSTTFNINLAANAPAGPYTTPVLVTQASTLGNTVSGERSYTVNGSTDTLAIVGRPAVTISAVNTTVVNEGASVAYTISGSFTDNDGTFTGVLDWGDGTTSPLVINNAAKTYSYTGNHTYAQSGAYSMTAAVTNAQSYTGSSSATIITVNNVAPVVAAPNAPSPEAAVAGFSTSFTLSGSFTDPAGSLDAPYTATVNWGDGTTGTPATIIGSGNPFGYSVTANHTYATSGAKSVTVTVTDANGGSTTSDPITIQVIGSADYAVTTTSDSVTIVDNSGNGDTLTVSEPAGGQIRFASLNRYFSLNGGPLVTGSSGNVPLAGITQVTINPAGGDDIVTFNAMANLPSITINDSAGGDQVWMNSMLLFANGRSLQVNANSISVGAGGSIDTSGAGTIRLLADTMSIGAGAALTSSSSVELAPISANRPIILGFESGIALSLTSSELSLISTPSLVIGSATAGSVDIQTSISAANASSLVLRSGGSITSPSGFSLINPFLTLEAGTGIGTSSQPLPTVVSKISATTATGRISIRNSGNLQVGDAATNGIQVNGGNEGIVLEIIGSILVTKQIKSPGAISLTATGATSDLTVQAGFDSIQTTATATPLQAGISLRAGRDLILGTAVNPGDVNSAGATRLSASNDVVVDATTYVLSNGNLQASAGGDVLVSQAHGTGSVLQVVGTGDSTISATGSITLHGGTAQTVAANGGAITLITDQLNIPTTGIANVVSTTGVLTIKPSTLGLDISVGTTIAGPLSLTDALLDKVTVGGLALGDSTTGSVTVSDTITRAAATNVTLASGSDISLNGGTINTAGGNLTLVPGTAPALVRSTLTGTDAPLGGGKLAINGTLELAISGTTAGTGYEQLIVNGTVDASATALMLTDSHVPVTGDTFTLVNNDGTADAVTGSFVGLPEGGTVTFNGILMRITYVGGDGNDIVLSLANRAPTNISLTSASLPENAGANAEIGMLSSTDPDTGDTFTYSLVSGTGDLDNIDFNIFGNKLRLTASANYEAKSSYSVRIRTTDQGTLSYDKQFTITITDVAENPTITAIDDIMIDEDTATGALDFTIADQDAGSTLTVTATSNNQALVPDANIILGGTGADRSVYVSPVANGFGTADITVVVSDGTLTGSTTYTVTVNSVNDEPVIANGGLPDVVLVASDRTTSLNLETYFSDIETASSALVYTVTPAPGAPFHNLSRTGNTLNIAATAPGEVIITVTAQDADSATVTDSFTLRVKHVPEIAGTGIPDTLLSPASTGLDIILGNYFLDQDSDALTYTVADNTEPGIVSATIDEDTLTLRPLGAGVATLTVRATDSDGNFTGHTFDVTVNQPVPDPIPTVTSPPKLNRQTGLYEITLTATNNNQFNVPGFRFRVTSALPAGTRLYNSTAAPGSSEAYLDVLTMLTPGQSITVVLEFYSSTRNFAGFEPTIIAEPLPEGISNAGTGEGMAVNRFVILPDESVLIEFSSIAGRWYQIEYSSDMVTWKRSLVPVQAGANFTQWIDRGAPYTESHPSTVPSRFYRVSEILPN